jgi:hypothetical protein
VGQYEATKKKSPETAPWPAPASRHRIAPRMLHVTVAPVPTSQLSAALGPCRVAPGAPRVTAAPVPTSAQGSSGAAQGSSGAPRVTAAPVTTARLRAAPGLPHVPVALGRMKIVEPSNSENRAMDNLFSTHRPAKGSSGGSDRADVEDIAEPGRCEATPI